MYVQHSQVNVWTIISFNPKPIWEIKDLLYSLLFANMLLMEQKVLTALEWYVSYITYKLLISSKNDYSHHKLFFFFQVVSIVELYDLIIYLGPLFSITRLKQVNMKQNHILSLKNKFLICLVPILSRNKALVYRALSLLF